MMDIKREGLTIVVNGKSFPHGSGIDGEWEWTESNDEVIFTNYFHTITSHGFYCCCVPFSVAMSDGKVTDINVSKNNCNFCHTDDLEEYLWDIFTD
jgi:hypothetical protein